MCYLDLPIIDEEGLEEIKVAADEEILMYENSQGHNHVAIVTNT